MKRKQIRRPMVDHFVTRTTFVIDRNEVRTSIYFVILKNKLSTDRFAAGLSMVEPLAPKRLHV